MKSSVNRFNNDFNDETFLKSVYQNNYSTVEKYILRNSGSIEDAKDIYQEAFISVWRNIQMGKFHPESTSSFNGYLYTVAKNKWIDYLRSNQFKHQSSNLNDEIFKENEEDNSEEALQFEKSIQLVKEAFQHLGDNCKNLLTSFYYAKESLKKIAEVFGWTEATTKNNKYRCLQKLREIVKK